MSETLVIHYPPELPVSARREELARVIRDNQVVIVAGETGSGKTTQLPKLCLELGRERIAHTQPRRLAARTVAARIAEELRVPLGTDVGYAVRFHDRSSRDTRIIEVSGRTYPVEVRYRPVEDADRDQEDAIADAVEELQREGPGDVLVFLSGEREIRDTADVLLGRLRSDVEVLPLYARLSAAEQQR